MNIDRIISESINRFILSEGNIWTFTGPYQVEVTDANGNRVMKWIRTKEEHIKRIEDMVKKKQQANPNYVPPPRPGRPSGGGKKVSHGLSFMSKPIEISKQINEYLKNKELDNLRYFIQNSAGVYGDKTTKALVNMYKDHKLSNGKNLFVEFSKLCGEIDEKTNNVINWGKRGERAIYSQLDIISRDIREAIQCVFDLKNITDDLMNRGAFSSFTGNGKRGNIIDGYSRINAKGKTVIYMLGLKHQLICKSATSINNITKELLSFSQLLDEIVKNRDSVFY